MYPDSLMVQAFGTTTPDTATRTAYFFDMWMQWRSNRYITSSGSSEQIRSILKKSGLRDLWDYQLKGNEIRFQYPEDLAMFKIHWESV
jgi:hypothetical protein